MTEQTQSKTPRFPNEKYMNLQTFRQSGVATPVWFAESDHLLYVRTFSKTGKAKRLRRETRVRVVPSDPRGEPKGEWLDAEARIVSANSDEAHRANRRLNEKYGLTKRLTEMLFGLKYGAVVTVAIKV